MIEKKIHIDKYDWTIILLLECDCSNNKSIIDYMEYMNCPDYIIYEALENLETCNKNIGLTYSNKKIQTSIIVVSKASANKEVLNTVTHEFYHLVTHISDAYNIIDDEEKATLMGNLCMVVYNIIIDIFIK